MILNVSSVRTRPGTQPDRRAQRRAARRDDNRTEILDAAEVVFGARGVRNGSLREIAAQAGFSTGAIYLFFESKEHLLAEALTRRATELVTTLKVEAERDRAPLAKLHAIIDAMVAFFDARPHFRGLLRHMSGGAEIVGPALAEHAVDVDGLFDTAMGLLAEIVRSGQRGGEIRDGDAAAIARLYSVLVNEQVLLGDAGAGTLTREQFHGLVDGALRRPLRSAARPGPRRRATPASR
jgi:AcrR family transcriptional regulator